MMELKDVFEPIINFLKSLQKKEKENSKVKAKERLQLVLVQDRASVSPDFFEMMKKELIEVIKKYIEIDEEALEVQLTRGFEEGMQGPTLYANIPIKNIKPVAPKIQLKEEIQEDEKEKVKEEIQEEVKEEMQEEIQKEAKEEMQEEIQKEAKEEMQEEIQKEAKEEIKENVKEETNEVKENIVQKPKTKKTNNQQGKKKSVAKKKR